MGAAQDKDREFMERALALAVKAAGRTAPNPMVGSVLVKDSRIVGEGLHEGPGLAHAEVAAINAAGDDAKGATAYVTLEPCNHTGRTGPCTEALIAASVAEVVYALADPNPQAAGGAERLRKAGVKVRSGVCETEARHLNCAWLHGLQEKRSYVIAKSAISLDGRVSTASGESQWITGEESRRHGHQLRASADAIITGAGTVIADDPSLTARLDDRIHQPLRVVLDTTARTAPGAKVFERGGKGALLVTTNSAPSSRLAAFTEMGVDILTLGTDANGRPDVTELLPALYECGVLTAMIEAGGGVLGSFFDADLIDEIALFVAPKLIGGGKAAFGGRGIDALSEAGRFEFAAPAPKGSDFLYYGVRKRGGV